MRRWFTAACAALAMLLGAGPAPSATPDTNPALNAPDMVAWRLFLTVNAQAGTVNANNALFETWASDGDLFRPAPVWPTDVTAKVLRPAILPTLLGQTLRARPHGATMQVVAPTQGVASEETRRNRPAFDYIVANKLYKVSGLRAAFGKTITFPADSLEVKANWYAVDHIPGYTGDPAKAGQVYHVNRASDGKLYALVSMHVISKLVPNWTWATFEHRNNPQRCDILGCHDAFGAVVANTPPNPGGKPGYGDCVKTPALIALFKQAKIDPAFANYCLKGSQTDFTDTSGLAIRVGNSITEAGFVQQASCMTCHGKAAFNASGQATTGGGFDGNGNASIGALDPNWFWATAADAAGNQNPPLSPMFQGQGLLAPPQQWATSVDFVWSIAFCAIDDSTPTPPRSLCAAK